MNNLNSGISDIQSSDIIHCNAVSFFGLDFFMILFVNAIKLIAFVPVESLKFTFVSRWQFTHQPMLSSRTGILHALSVISPWQVWHCT